MVEKSVHNNPQDPIEEIFERLEVQVTDIGHNMKLLMEYPTDKVGIFRDDGGSNLEIRSEKKSEKEKPISSAMNPSQSLFKMEVKLDIEPYQGDIDALKLNHLLQQLEVYFSVHHIDEEYNILFARLKLEGHALTWWESHI
jgi:hypothetical protein